MCVGASCSSWAPCADALACTCERARARARASPRPATPLPHLDASLRERALLSALSSPPSLRRARCEYYFNDLYCFYDDWAPKRLANPGGWKSWEESDLRFPLSTNEKWMSMWLDVNASTPGQYEYNASVLNAVDAKAESDDKWAPWASCAALYTIEMTGNALSGWGGAGYAVYKVRERSLPPRRVPSP